MYNWATEFSMLPLIHDAFGTIANRANIRNSYEQKIHTHTPELILFHKNAWMNVDSPFNCMNIFEKISKNVRGGTLGKNIFSHLFGLKIDWMKVLIKSGELL